MEKIRGENPHFHHDHIDSTIRVELERGEASTARGRREMTQQSESREFWLLRRGDQAVVAGALAAGLIVLLGWWTFQGGWRGGFVEVDEAQSRAYSFKVDVNRAAWPELAQLPDMGEVTARKIVASRQSEGPFADIDDLRRVHGIGPKTVQRLRPYLLPIEDRP